MRTKYSIYSVPGMPNLVFSYEEKGMLYKIFLPEFEGTIKENIHMINEYCEYYGFDFIFRKVKTPIVSNNV